jgi:hypothetical protein
MGAIILDERPDLPVDFFSLEIPGLQDAADILEPRTPLSPLFDYLGFRARVQRNGRNKRIELTDPPLASVIRNISELPIPEPHGLVKPIVFHGDLFSLPGFMAPFLANEGVLVSARGERRHDMFVHFLTWLMTARPLVRALQDFAVDRMSAGALEEFFFGNTDAGSEGIEGTIQSDLGRMVVMAFQNEPATTDQRQLEPYWSIPARHLRRMLPGDTLPLAFAIREHCIAVGQAALAHTSRQAT